MGSNIFTIGLLLFAFTARQLALAKSTNLGCGRKPSRIIGGGEVTPYSIPWQVGIEKVARKVITCGGTLISDKHVLTAAHCMAFHRTEIPIPASDVIVVVEEHDQTDGSDGTRHEICHFKNHQRYDSSSAAYDFSILHLKEPVELGYRAIPACLPDSAFWGDALEGQYLTVSGWGNVDPDAVFPKYPDVLHSVKVPVISQDQCRNSWISTGHYIDDSMICAGSNNGEVGSCHRDSGGPLTYQRNGKNYVIGVVSFGHRERCAHPEYPSVFARVTKVSDWIQEQLKTTC